MNCLLGHLKSGDRFIFEGEATEYEAVSRDPNNPKDTFFIKPGDTTSLFAANNWRKVTATKKGQTTVKDLNNAFDFSASHTVILKNRYGNWQKGAFQSLSDAAKQADQEVRFDDEATAEIHAWPYKEGAVPVDVRVGEKRAAKEAALAKTPVGACLGLPNPDAA